MQNQLLIVTISNYYIKRFWDDPSRGPEVTTETPLPVLPDESRCWAENDSENEEWEPHYDVLGIDQATNEVACWPLFLVYLVIYLFQLVLQSKNAGKAPVFINRKCKRSK